MARCLLGQIAKLKKLNVVWIGSFSLRIGSSFSPRVRYDTSRIMALIIEPSFSQNLINTMGQRDTFRLTIAGLIIRMQVLLSHRHGLIRRDMVRLFSRYIPN
ncbi:hypothetical protein LINGRAPRIM_LOCUS2675 [Linum grandiflorum]